VGVPHHRWSAAHVGFGRIADGHEEVIEDHLDRRSIEALHERDQISEWSATVDVGADTVTNVAHSGHSLLRQRGRGTQ
jgi:hypothetical protein